MSEKKRWYLAIHVIPAGGDAMDDKEMEMVVEATDGRLALIRALAGLELNEGDLLHWVHIGAPQELTTRFKYEPPAG